MATAYVALGSNLGNRRAVLDAAICMIDSLPGTTVVARSTFRDTTPVDATPESPRFLNSAIAIETRLEPEELMRELLAIEHDLGRKRTERNAPRIIDLDLLLYEGRTFKTELLTLPHPRMGIRRFVLEPLAQIAPDLVHPETGRTILDMLEELPC
jgi:2-amino-4-hydroxy-6-hydroxymethyldihydropteridine diphosphokinase